MKNIRTNPTLAAVFYFVLTWVSFPLAAFFVSQMRSISFAAAAGRPYLLMIFTVGSIISAVQMYYKTKNSAV